jgi:uncharacterized protein YkwD
MLLFSFVSGIFVKDNPVLAKQAVLDAKTTRQTTLEKPKNIKQKISQLQEIVIEFKKAPTPTPTPVPATQAWGMAKQIGEHTWTMNVGSDARVGSTQEIFVALNAYRQRHGVGVLSWDNGLGNFAQSRADLFNTRGNTDTHAGFTDFINNQDGFKKLGFMSLGENSSFGYHVEAVHLIEWIYAGDAPHDNNQLNPQWSFVGIGVNGVATDLIFGGNRI